LKLLGNALLVQHRVSGRVAVTEKPDELARRFSHDHRLKDPIHTICVIAESGSEIHREPVHQDLRPKVAITFEKLG
jgi:hypothetical protein